MVQPQQRTVWMFLKKRKIDLPYDPVIPVLGLYISGENHNLKRYMHPMFTAALFTTVKKQKQPKCSSINAWIKKMWYIHTERNITLPLKKK